MRILHLVHQFPPDHVAGTEIYTQTLARRQAGAGHRVAVFAPVSRKGPLSVAEESGVRVYRAAAGARSARQVFTSIFGHPALDDAFEEVLAAEQPDIVHIQHLMGLPAGLVEALDRGRIPYVLHLHDYWFGCANGQLLTNYDETLCDGPDAAWRNCGRCALARAGLPAPGPAAALVAPTMARRAALLHPVFAGARRVLSPTDFVRQAHRRMGLPVERAIIFPHGTEPPDPPLPIRPERAPGPLRLGYVGSLNRQKGVHVLIDAVNRMADGTVRLTLYGNPDVFPDYVAALKARSTHPGITFAGVLGRADLWPRLAELDALVLPTLWYEASPLVIGEAFAAGLPIVASRIGALPELIRDGVDGLLFPPGDASALSDVLQSLAGRQDIVAALRAGVRPPLTMAGHVAAIEAVYREALALA